MDRQGDTSRDDRDVLSVSAPAARDHLIVLFECDRPLTGPMRCSLHEIDEVIVARGEARAVRQEFAHGVSRLRVTVPDRLVSSTHARLLRTQGGWDIEDLHSTNGTFIDGRREARAKLSGREIFECGRTVFALGRNWPTPDDSPWFLDLGVPEAMTGLASVIPHVAHEFEGIRRAAASRSPVLFLAETGAGKEVAARAVHDLSGRSGEFVPVNCGALTSSLAESLLFGHVRGAFSGAVKNEDGFVRAADGGTLFLDEIGDLPLASQPLLLRVLQEQQVTPLGSPKGIGVDLRIVAATHRSLPALASRGDFRHDLLARLDGFTFVLPPVRERRFDIGLFVSRILQRLPDPRIPRLSFTPEAARALFLHAWPSNVRELEQCLLRALTLSSGETIDRKSISFGVLSSLPKEPLPTLKTIASDNKSRDDLIALLRQHRGNIAAVAREAGKMPIQIRRWIKKYEIDLNDFRD
jgi:hypothetical protein